ncbi:hypothetical protein BpHYR1_022620 [Brachionus plicatilis]|uniref:Uncharacterized protein n=1 Tax=Brachionus plicatilis TaxID=10195 RepID=A0A3M7RXD7_BRAPC|nr:hypothetical protein BpHYR1_022620 [Brachionus plicatilis]
MQVELMLTICTLAVVFVFDLFLLCLDDCLSNGTTDTLRQHRWLIFFSCLRATLLERSRFLMRPALSGSVRVNGGCANNSLTAVFRFVHTLFRTDWSGCSTRLRSAPERDRLLGSCCTECTRLNWIFFSCSSSSHSSRKLSQNSDVLVLSISSTPALVYLNVYIRVIPWQFGMELSPSFQPNGFSSYLKKN